MKAVHMSKDCELSEKALTAQKCEVRTFRF